jgi:hypothetical protein
MKQNQIQYRLNKLNEIIYYFASIILAFIALITSDIKISYACLSVLVIGQSIYGIICKYKGQTVVYFITTFVLLEIIRPLNLNIIKNHEVLLNLFYLFIYAVSLIVSRYGFKLDLLNEKNRIKKATNICLFVILLLFLVFSTSSSIFLSEHRIITSKVSVISIVIIAFWFIPWLGFALKLFDKVKNLIYKKTCSNRLDFITLLSIGLITGLAYLFLYRPGFMSGDSIDQWNQAIGNRPLSDWHPYLHTLIIRLLTMICKSPIMLPLLQIALSAFIYASWGKFLINRGANRIYIYILLFVFSLLPMHAMLNISLWKDVLNTLALVYLTLQFAKIIVYKENYFNSLYNNISFVVSTILVWSTRHNGFMVGIFTILAISVYLIAYVRFNRNRKKSILFNICIVIFLIIISEVIIKEVIPSIMDVTPNAKGVKYLTFLSPLGAIAKDELYINAETLELMESVMPIEIWKQKYYEYSVNQYLWDTDGVFINNTSKLGTFNVLSIYFKNLLNYPTYVIADRINQTSILWNITDIDVKIYSVAYDIEMKEHNIPTYNSKIGQDIIKFLQKHNQLLFNLGIYSLVLILLLYYIIVKEHYKLCILYIPIVANTLSLIIAMPGQDYRLGYYLFELFPFILTYVLVEMKNEEKNNIKVTVTCPIYSTTKD